MSYNILDNILNFKSAKQKRSYKRLHMMSLHIWIKNICEAKTISSTHQSMKLIGR